MYKKLFYLCVILVLAFIAFISYKGFKYAKQTEQQTAKIAKNEEIKITLLEGWNLNDIINYLENKHLTNKDTFTTAQKNFTEDKYPLLKSKPLQENLEGYIFPDTYLINKPLKKNSSETAQEIIKKSLDNFNKKFNPEMQKQADKRNMSVYEILTLASIIEKETGRNAVTTEQKQKLDEERKIVAGIFYNRLKSGVALQSDATINYITGKNTPSPSQVDLEVKSAYNTYKNKGLPPTPICNPSLSSILAALQPSNTDYFYFLHKQPSGEPVYAKTFQEHIANKFKYLK